MKNSKFNKLNTNINQEYPYESKGISSGVNNYQGIDTTNLNLGNSINLNDNEYSNFNNIVSDGLNLSNIRGKNINLKSSSNMIYTKDELMQERLNNNSNSSDPKLGKYIGMGKNLMVDSEFIPIKESNEIFFNKILKF